MDDRHAHFLIAVAELCTAASLASLDVELTTADGVRTGGVPATPRRTTGADEVDDSGYARTLRIDERAVDLDEVVECTLHAPETALR